MFKHGFFYVLAGICLFACNGGDELPNPDTDIPFVRDHFAADGLGNSYLTGFDQVSQRNRDPFIQKNDSKGARMWRLRYEETLVSGRGTLLAWHEGKLFAVFTTDADSAGITSITRHQALPGAFEGVFQSSYGSRGGPRVSIVAEIDTETGKIKKGTFLASRLTDGNTNYLLVDQIGFSQGKIVLRAMSGMWPPGVGTSYVRFPGLTDADAIEGIFYLRYELNPDFTAITKAEVLQEPF